jgi:lipopolysaccharide/colanic/teichoic acid biosynthesis glycosyltransferase
LTTANESRLADPEPVSITLTRVADPFSAHDTLYARLVKPFCDRLLALILVVLLAPLMIVIAIGVRITLGRPVLYRQRRTGKDGRTFVLWKFRTMLPDRRRVRVPVPVDQRVCHKREDDPRHVPFGTFLRRTSLDELPQLLNVLWGHMSLVGPRPELVELVEQYEPWQHQRHVVKPGLTGLWQVSGRGDGMMHDNVHLDLEYLNTLSFRTDVRIMFRTPRVLLVRSGS